MKQKLERNKPSSSRIPSFTEWASGKYFFIQGEGLFFVFFLHKTSSSNWPIAAAFVLWIWVCSPGVWFMYALMCVCVCVCARVQIMCAEWTLWGSAHEGSALLEYVSPASSTPDPFLLIYWETVPSTNFSVPDGASGFYSPLTLVKNVFWEPWESFGVIMDLFKTKQSQDIEKILKKKKKRKTRTEMMKSFENTFVTYLIFKKNLQYQPHKLLTISWGGR